MVTAAPPLVVAAPTKEPIRELTSYTLDLAYGDSENNFELTTPERLAPGSLIWMDGTAYGGIIDVVQTNQTPLLTYKGRTWTGILDTRVIEPPPGADHRTVEGPAHQILQGLLDEAGLSGLFTVASTFPPVTMPTFQFDRYTTVWEGLTKLLTVNIAKLSVQCIHDRIDLTVLVGARIRADGEHTRFTAARDYHPVNHLIALGKGELKDREVLHLYADADGGISRTQTLTGLDEVQAVYELSNADSTAELAAGAEKRLRELQSGRSAADIDLSDASAEVEVGDMVTASDPVTGLTTTVRVVKKIVKVNASGALTVSADVGDPNKNTR